MSRNQTTIPAASGYPQYAALTDPIFADTTIARFYCDAVAPIISSTEIVPSQIKDCGHEVEFKLRPVGELFDLQKNQELEVSDLSIERVRMTVNRAKYWNLKLDALDMVQVCDIDKWIDGFIMDTNEKMKRLVDTEMLLQLPHEVDCHNKGAKAGKESHSYNLGTIGDPLVINKDNVFDMLTKLKMVMDEACLPESGRYIVLPTAAQYSFYRSELRDACMTGMNESILLVDRIPKVMGFDIVFSNNVPPRTDPITNQTTYTILAGIRQATAFVSQISQSRVIESERHFGKLWQGFQVYDFKVLQPEALAVAYATFPIA